MRFRYYRCCICFRLPLYLRLLVTLFVVIVIVAAELFMLFSLSSLI
jgi:hypothetical protein